MPRTLALWLAVVALAGCRTPPPSMDPFLRTTVPPPGTAPGDQYYQGSGQPAAVPAATPAPVVPPPSKYAPPGGSFNYQQSSIDRPKAVTPGSGGLRLGSNWLTQGMAVKIPPPSTALAVRGAELPVAANNLPPEAFALPAMTPLAGLPTANSQAAKSQPSTANAAQPTLATQPKSAFQPNVSAPPAAGTTLQLADGTTLRAEPTLAKATTQIQLASATELPAKNDASTAVFRESVGSAASDASPSSAETGTVIRILGPRNSDDSSTAAAGVESTSSAEPVRASFNEITNLPLASPAHRAAVSATWTRSGQSGGSLTASGLAGSPTIVEAAIPTPVAAVATSVPSADKYAFAPDYSSLRGRLEYSQSARQWKLRYIPIDGQTDRFGGSVVLPASPLLEAFKPGDYVSVAGTLTSSASSTRGFSPLYDLRQIEPAR